MTISTKAAAALAAAVLCATASIALGDEAGPCSLRVDRNNLVACALRASLVMKTEGHEVEAAEGRKLAASQLLPSNPVLSVSAARRTFSGAGAYNWDATLSQEVEIAGQRGVRRSAAQAEIDARRKRVFVFRRDTAAAAWAAFFNLLAAREERRLAERLMLTTQALALAAHARADKGLIAPVDADVADAAAIRVLQAKLAADRGMGVAEASLMSLLGLDPTLAPVAIDGELMPLAGIDSPMSASLSKNVAERPEIATLDAERKALELRADAFRRARIPNPTVSVFVQNDGFDERVFGVGLSVPIPLPGNVGRTYLGEIAEAEALSRGVATVRERIEREVRLGIVTAVRAFESRAKEVEAFTPETVGRAERTLQVLSQEVEAGRVSVREAVVTQQALIELLQANVAARRAWCLVSVELARVAGLSLESGPR